MMHRPNRRRPGASLVEVLVGFGILGVGVTSVITLFPFSALTMGQALKDDRTTTCAAMADGQIRDVHRRYVVDPESNKAKTGGSMEPYFLAFDNPAGTGASTLSGLQPLQSPANDSEPSYPVFVDPMGIAASRGAIGDNGEALIARTSLSLLNNDQLLALRYCSLMDSLSFNEDGNVDTTVGSRELRYNYAWMLQRPTNRDKTTARVQIVVFNKRTHLYAPTGTEAVTTCTFNPTDTTITGVPTTTDVRKGMWVLDAGDPQNGIRNAEFYRVVSVTDVGGTYSLEVHKPIVRADGSAAQYSGRLVVMPGVADVFDRPNLTGN